eukprot:scaffold3309_cov118-Skeletonema_dohrnii-CCMP3373.AAC.8
MVHADALTVYHTTMKQVVAKAAVAAAAATGGGTQRRMAVVNHEPQPQHKLFNGRHLQDAVDTSTVSIGGTAFFDVNGNGELNLDQGDGSINPISNSAISVLAELWSCDNGQNLGYQLTDASGNYVFTVPAEPGRACYYVRFDTSSMEGTFSCSGQPKCATDNLMLSAGQEALDIDVGIQSSDFDTLVAALEEDIVDEEPVTDDGDGWSISGGLVFEPMTYQPTYVIPSRPSPAVSTPPPTFATFVPDTPSPSVKEATLIPTNSPSAGIITAEPPEDNDDTEQQATSSSGLIQLNSQVRVMLSNIESPMEDNSQELFEDVCDTFLNEQLAIAVPPVSYIKCTVVDQSVESGRRRRLRNLEHVERLLGSTLAVEVVVTGVALPTNTIKTQEQVKFQDKIAGTFTAQGDQFVRLLKKEEAKVVTDFNDATFPTLDRVWVVKIMEGTGFVMTSNENDGSSIGLIAAIAAGGAVLLLLAIFLVVRFRSQKRKQQDLKDIGSNETESSLSPNNGSRLPNNTIGYFSTPVLSSSGIEVDHRDVSPTDMSSRVQRDVMCPPGKLRILIANTQGYGPAIHTIKPNSPVEGLLFVGDIIVAVNDTNTRNSRADEITRLLKVTVREERKITVLSLRR